MKTLQKLGLVSMITFSWVLKSEAQEILTDHEGLSLFTVPTTLVAPKIAGNNIGIRFPAGILRTRKYYIIDADSGQRVYTMTKSRAFYGHFKAINSSDDILIINKKSKLLPFLELGYNNTLDSLINPDRKAWFYSTFAISGFVKLEHYNVYNGVTQTTSTDAFVRLSPGVKVALNLFRKKDYAIALTGTYQRAVNSNNLTAYQNITSNFFTDGKVASNGNKDGYLQPVEAEHIFRFSTTVPLFMLGPLKLFNPTTTYKSWIASALQKLRYAQIVPAPYYYLTASRYHQPSHNIGASIIILPKRIFEQRGEHFSEALTIGYNIINTVDRANGKFFFLSGTLSFGDLKPAKGEPIERK